MNVTECSSHAVNDHTKHSCDSSRLPIMRPLDQFHFLPQILEWFRTTGANYLQRTELGETYAGAKYIQEQHSQFEAEARVRHKCLEPYWGGGVGGGHWEGCFFSQCHERIFRQCDELLEANMNVVCYHKRINLKLCIQKALIINNAVLNYGVYRCDSSL